MLAASRMHEDSERGEPNDSSPSVQLCSNWDGDKRLRHAMRERGDQMLPGCSWIEAKKKTSLFSAGDKFHPNASEISGALNHLTALMSDVGYVSDLILVWLDEDEVFVPALQKSIRKIKLVHPPLPCWMCCADTCSSWKSKL